MYKNHHLEHCFKMQISLHLSLNFLFIIGMILMLTACDAALKQIDYALEPQNISAKNNPDRPIGSISLHMSDKEEPYAVNLGRIRGGAQLYTTGPSFKNEEAKTELKSLWIISRDRYRDWFMGIKGSYTF